MGVLIDSSVLIAHERTRVDLGLPDRIAGRESEPFYLSVVTASELLHGVHRAADAGRRARRAAFVEGVLGQFPMLPLDLPTARIHAELWAELAGKGHTVPAHDFWIAATAVARGLTLVTTNLRDFERVPGLDLEHWAS